MIFERKLFKISNSIVLTIPQDLAKYYDLEEGSEVTIIDDEDKIVIKKK